MGYWHALLQDNWSILGDVQYVDQYVYINDGIFAKFCVKKDDVFDTLFSIENVTSNNITKSALETLMVSFIAVTERQLVDFLPGGKYCEEPTIELRTQMKHCRLTNLLSENEFGDLDFWMFKRRSASLHYHSGVQMVKRNKTISTWL